MTKTWKHDGVTYREGDEVTLNVKWPGGRTTNVRGKLITIADGEAFVDSQLGPVAGDLETLERA